MAPAHAVPRLLARNNLTLQDFDYYEIHEAFAATGARIIAAAAKQWALHRQQTGKSGRTLISICAAGGLGVAAILEG